MILLSHMVLRRIQSTSVNVIIHRNTKIALFQSNLQHEDDVYTSAASL